MNRYVGAHIARKAERCRHAASEQNRRKAVAQSHGANAFHRTPCQPSRRRADLTQRDRAPGGSVFVAGSLKRCGVPRCHLPDSYHRWLRALKTLLLAAALAVSASCNLQEPASIDGLGPDPATDTLVITPQDIKVPVGSVVIFAAPDQTVEGTPVTGPVEWTVAGGEGGTITTAGLFQASDTGGYMVRGKRSGKTGQFQGHCHQLGQRHSRRSALHRTPSRSSRVRRSPSWSTASCPTAPPCPSPERGPPRGHHDQRRRLPRRSTSGQFRVIVTQQGGTLADTAAVTISAAAPTLQPCKSPPTTVSLTPGGAQQFNAVGRMSDGSSASVTVTWSETGGSITSAGRYTAGSTAGSFRVIATQQGGTKADTSAVTITPAAPTLVKV